MKITKKRFQGEIILSIVLAFLFAWVWNINMPYDNMLEFTDGSTKLQFGSFHMLIQCLLGFGVFWFGIATLGNLYLEEDGKFKDGDGENWKLPPLNKYKIYIILFLILLFGYKFYDNSKFIYNKSIIYHNNYDQKVQEKLGFYDKLWKTYLQKEKITNLNKETFIQVTALIMENRKDGNQIAWKWIQENQQIPYSEFTSFYQDLSLFIESQRAEYFNIEKQCQSIANANNTLLDTLPNNLYNKIIGCKQIKFEYGFLSKKTDEVFRFKSEDIK